MDAQRNKVLVVDDEAGPRESLRMVLKNEYDVLLADRVDRGLELLKQEAPDVVIMDIRMPGKSGIDGLRELRAIDPRVAVIMLTGYGSLETAQDAIRLGANDYLKKPFDIREITETVRRNVLRTRLERRKNKAIEELQQLNMNLHEQVALKEEWAKVGEATREFAHDLRNPLTIILGYCDLLSEQLRKLHEPEDTDAGNETLDYLQTIEQNVQRCRQLAEQWQSPGGHTKIGAEEVALDALLHETVKSLEPLSTSGTDRVRYVIEAQPVRVKADRLQLLRAVYNIVTNALHALPPEGGRISLHCTQNENWAQVVIEDNGSGIPEPIRDRVFEQCFTTKPPEQGTGLGLFITQKIIQEHGGTVAIESEPGRGTRVTISLPVSEASSTERG